MEDRICDICEKPFTPTHPRQKRHPGECTLIYDRRSANARYQRKAAKSRTWNPKPQKCEYCPKIFRPKVKGQITCGNVECKNKHKSVRNKMLTKQWREAERERNAPEIQMDCPFERMDFLPPGCRSFLEAQMMPV